MLNFVICDDNSNILQKLSVTLENIFTKYNYDGVVSYQTSDVDNLLQYIDEIYTCEGFYLKSSSKNPRERIISQDCKDSYLLIGDSANDMNFAQKMGIKFVWFNPSRKIDEVMNSTLEISSFQTLKDYF